VRASTAQNMLTFNIRISQFDSSPSDKASVIERYVRRYSQHLNKPSAPLVDQRVRIFRPTQRIPSWLPSVERRIRQSVAPSTRAALDRGKWLTFEAADAAAGFLDKTADLLPNEPFIYASNDGDLIAEFEGKHGTLTAVVSPGLLILFASVGSVPVQKTVKLKEATTTCLRRSVRDFSEMLRTGHHGTVDAIRR
jgi:hypothetical protein